MLPTLRKTGNAYFLVFSSAGTSTRTRPSDPVMTTECSLVDNYAFSTCWELDTLNWISPSMYWCITRTTLIRGRLAKGTSTNYKWYHALLIAVHPSITAAVHIATNLKLKSTSYCIALRTTLSDNGHLVVFTQYTHYNSNQSISKHCFSRRWASGGNTERWCSSR